MCTSDYIFQLRETFNLDSEIKALLATSILSSIQDLLRIWNRSNPPSTERGIGSLQTEMHDNTGLLTTIQMTNYVCRMRIIFEVCYKTLTVLLWDSTYSICLIDYFLSVQYDPAVKKKEKFNQQSHIRHVEHRCEMSHNILIP